MNARSRVTAGEIKLAIVYRGMILRNILRRTMWNVLSGIGRIWSGPPKQVELIRDDAPRRSVYAGTWMKEAYALRVEGKLSIEPTYGWIVGRSFHLVERSMPYHDWSRSAPNLWSKPSVAVTFLAQTRTTPQVISMHTPWDTNYFHFFNDVLGRLRLLDSLQIPADVPIAVSSRLAERGYFQDSVRLGVFDGRPIVVQSPRERLGCDVVYSLQKYNGDRRDYDFFLDRLLSKTSKPVRERRVFLSRSPFRGRTLSNNEAAASLSMEFGFEVVDTDGWGLHDQIDLFRSASHVVGVHGAGLTNVMFRRGRQLQVLEILPPGEIARGFNSVDRLETEYASICRFFDFQYDSFHGSIQQRQYTRSLNFEVDLEDLRCRLESF